MLFTHEYSTTIFFLSFFFFPPIQVLLHNCVLSLLSLEQAVFLRAFQTSSVSQEGPDHLKDCCLPSDALQQPTSSQQLEAPRSNHSSKWENWRSQKVGGYCQVSFWTTGMSVLPWAFPHHLTHPGFSKEMWGKGESENSEQTQVRCRHGSYDWGLLSGLWGADGQALPSENFQRCS